MKKFLIGSVFVIFCFLSFYLRSSGGSASLNSPGHPVSLPLPAIREIVGIVQKGESLFDIFQKHNLDLETLAHVTAAAKNVYNLVKLKPLRSYIITTLRRESGREDIHVFKYGIDDSAYLKIAKRPDGYRAERVIVPYERRLAVLSGTIEDNLISSVGDSVEHLRLAFNLADIFESEIDFLTELRGGDHYRMLVEELWLYGVFKGYGDILSAEFMNNGRSFDAYRFEVDDKLHFFNGQGHSLRKALLRAPLRFRYISSRFSYRRKHPILKIYRPHLGIDYAAPAGTPVSAAGVGTVTYAGWKGQYGKCVIIRHPNGYETYYGHLARIKRGVRKGKKVAQGQIIGYVGSTGLSTGPHLDYRVKRFGKFINPLRIDLPRHLPVPGDRMEEFTEHVEQLKERITALDDAPNKVERSVDGSTGQKA